MASTVENSIGRKPCSLMSEEIKIIEAGSIKEMGKWGQPQFITKNLGEKLRNFNNMNKQFTQEEARKIGERIGVDFFGRIITLAWKKWKKKLRVRTRKFASLINDF